MVVCLFVCLFVCFVWDFIVQKCVILNGLLVLALPKDQIWFKVEALLYEYRKCNGKWRALI